MRDRERDREMARRRREANKAKGLTSKGTRRKPKAKPNEAQKRFVVSGAGPKKEKPIQRRNETPEQRRARGFSLRGTPMAADLEARVAKRLKEKR